MEEVEESEDQAPPAPRPGPADHGQGAGGWPGPEHRDLHRQEPPPGGHWARHQHQQVAAARAGTIIGTIISD